MLAYAEIDYEDIRIPVEEWNDFKDKTPFGQLPVLEVDGKQLPQNFAIARYIAAQHGLAGKDAFEAAWVDALADQLKDHYNAYSPYLLVALGFREGDKDKMRKEVGEPARDKHYAIFEKILKESPSGFLVGDGLTFVDIALATQVETTNKYDAHFLDGFPEVLKHETKIHQLPVIAKWIEKRPVTDH